MVEFQELVKDVPKFASMERGELVAYAYAMYAAGAKMDAENNKLRELCRRFSEYVSHDRCEGCVVKRRCNDGEIDECWQMGEIRKLARELGVEVG